MASQLVSLTIIALVAFMSPYIASLIPNRPIPETVFLIFAGAILGPYGFGFINTHGPSLEFLSELGLAFLFLMAGYEIDGKKLTGSIGKHACISWLASLAIALCLGFLIPHQVEGVGPFSLAIAMTTTAFGTLAPILRDRGLTNTKTGEVVSIYGAIGEILPIFAMALLLSSRAKITTVIIFMAFIAICIFVLLLPHAAKQAGSKIVKFLYDNAETGSQAPVRLTVLMLVFLVTISALFRLDVVLGAFAAGFILRSVLPDGDELLETKLEGIAFGFLVPVFFVVSGANVDLSAITRNPQVLLIFMLSLFLVRTIPVFVSLRLSPHTRDMNFGQQISSAIYCTMGLPLIVAITSIAVAADKMTSEIASVLVGAGALTVLIVPIITALTIRISAGKPLAAAREIVHNPKDIGDILHKHGSDMRKAHHELYTYCDLAKREGLHVSACEWLARKDDMREDDLS